MPNTRPQNVVATAPRAAPPVPADSCLSRLRALGVRFSLVQPIATSRSCRVGQPLSITEIVPGVRLQPESRLNCRTAEALALWMRDTVLPASRAELGTTPTAIVHDSTYVCRRRNNGSKGKMSEHATGNAIDIRQVALAGRDPLRVGYRHDRSEKAFQRRMRKGACRHFTTVLGPGSNAAHATHFHFDLAQRKSGYRLCQ